MADRQPDHPDTVPTGVEEADRGDAADEVRLVLGRVEEALIEADSREAVDRAVCETVATGSFARFVALFCHDRGALTYRTGAGIDATAAAATVGDDGPAHRAVALRHTQFARPNDDAPAGEGGVVYVPVTNEREVYRVLVVGLDRTGGLGTAERELFDRLGVAVGRAVGLLERRKRERTVDLLQEALGRLRDAGDPAAVAETTVDVATAALDAPGIGVFRFDDDTNRLRLAAATDRLRAFYDGETAFGPGPDDGSVWQAYATGETHAVDALGADSALGAGGAESAVFVPLSDHGVLVAAAGLPGTFDSRERQLLALLAGTATDALDRLAREQAVEQQRALLDRRAAELDRLDRTDRLRRDVTDVLVHADSRAQLEERVCDRLVDGETVAFAWVGAVPPEGSAVEPRVQRGTEGYLDGLDLDASSTEPAARVAHGEGPPVTADVTDHLQEGAWARAAAERGAQSVCAVELAYRGTRYGVLAVYAADPDGFVDTADLLVDLAGAVGYGINVVETRTAMLADRAVELELRVPDPGGFVTRVAGVVDRPVLYHELTPDTEATSRVLFALTDPPVEEIAALAEETDRVDALERVGEGPDHLYRATVAGDTVPAALVDCGAVPVEVRALPGEVRATVRLAEAFDVREFLGRVADRYPGAEMVARRSVDGPARTRGEFRAEVETQLTDRQLEVLRTAFESGFFESPRETTGAQLADLLGVSQPTVTRHLREGQRRLFALLFERPDGAEA